MCDKIRAAQTKEGRVGGSIREAKPRTEVDRATGAAKSEVARREVLKVVALVVSDRTGATPNIARRRALTAPWRKAAAERTRPASIVWDCDTGKGPRGRANHAQAKNQSFALESHEAGMYGVELESGGHRRLVTSETDLCLGLLTRRVPCAWTCVGWMSTQPAASPVSSAPAPAPAAKTQPAWKHFLAGNFGGIVGLSVAYPLDTVKVRSRATPIPALCSSASSNSISLSGCILACSVLLF
jgi:hypothetical protein